MEQQQHLHDHHNLEQQQLPQLGGIVHSVQPQDATDSGSGADPPLSKKPRRRYDNNFKAEVLEHLQTPGAKLPAIAKQFNIPDNTLREWTKVRIVYLFRFS
jgi:hypothetical protein